MIEQVHLLVLLSDAVPDTWCRPNDYNSSPQDHSRDCATNLFMIGDPDYDISISGSSVPVLCPSRIDILEFKCPDSGCGGEDTGSDDGNTGGSGGDIGGDNDG